MERPSARRDPPDPPLEDDAVLLRPPTTADAPAIAEACADPEIGRWVPIPIPYTLADAEAFLEIVRDGWATGAHATFAIEDRAGGRLAGMVALDREFPPARASVGYWLAPGVRGRGLATRAVRLVTAWAFEDPALERLELTTLVGNDPSGRVALRSGFRREGILRSYLPFREGTVDAVMYALVRADLEGGQRAGDVDDALAGVPLFAGLSATELAGVRSVATELSLVPGEVLMAEGAPGDALYVVLEGELAVTKRSDGGERPIATVGAGSVQGEIAVLSGGVRLATVRALTAARVLRLGRDDLFDVIAHEPGIVRSLVRTVAGRLASLEAFLQQQERLASLGTLAAGLAHELNNPAAAARSSAARLEEGLDEWDRASAALGALQAARDAADAALLDEVLDALREQVAERAADPPVLDPLDAADRRDAVAALLGDLGMAEPAEPAAALVGLGWDGNELDDLLGPFATDEARLVVVAWLCASALVRRLLAELGIATSQISAIVGAVREYTYLDRAPVQDVDVTTGIENTLVILRSKWKSGVTIHRAYDPDLPTLEAYGSELNQVWTNLVDNAIDAMGGSGDLAIAVTATAGRDGVAVQICDTGPGIPPEVRERIFDPFYTTKGVGAGTGLGLHIARSIVERHGGTLELAASEPGRTCFLVTLPRRAPTIPDPAGDAATEVARG